MSQSAQTYNAEVSHRGNPPHSNAYVHRTTVHQTVHQTGQKTGHSALRTSRSLLRNTSTVFYYLRKTAIPPSRNPAHHFRRLFDDSNALFVLNSVHTFGYNGTYPNIHAYY